MQSVTYGRFRTSLADRNAGPHKNQVMPPATPPRWKGITCKPFLSRGGDLGVVIHGGKPECDGQIATYTLTMLSP